MKVPPLMRVKKLMIIITCLVVFSLVVMYRPNKLLSASSTGKHILQKIVNYAISRQGENKKANIWYDPENPQNDRILSQMTYIPEHYKHSLEKDVQPKVKTILRYQGFPGHPFHSGDIVLGKRTFEKCPVSRCEVFSDRTRILKMDAVVFEHEHPPRTWNTFPTSQIWVASTKESPQYLSNTIIVSPNDQMNWTATYRLDSTLPVPYYKFITNGSLPKSTVRKNYAHGRTKQVAALMSNCWPYNSRMRYVNELRKYIDVDVYGRCGTKYCPKSAFHKCLNKIQRDYKFYLAFENANCRHYITEKFFNNGLNYDLLPIAMGASPFDYKMAAPPNSFLHVDDFRSPKELAEYLQILDKNDTLYNEYFKWKGSGTMENTEQLNFWCRLCSLLHEQDNQPPSWYTDVNEWWRGKGVCIGSGYWRDHPGSNTSLKMMPPVIGSLL